MKGMMGCAAMAVLAVCLDPSAWGTSQKDPVDYVSPNIGGIGQLLSATVPYVQYPHGMARLAPITTPGVTDRYLADKIYGFPVGPAVLMASVGPLSCNPEGYASDFDHDFEIATPYYYEADLRSWGIKAEVAPSQEAAYYRFTFPAGAHAHLALSMKEDSELTVVGDTAVQGSERITGLVAEVSGNSGETREYFYAEFSKPFSVYRTWIGDELMQKSKQSGNSIGFVTDTATHDGEQIEVRLGISYISEEQAHRNLEREIPTWTFEQVRSKARSVWNDTLSRVSITGGTERHRTIFYTALYRSLGRMASISAGMTIPFTRRRDTTSTSMTGSGTRIARCTHCNYCLIQHRSKT
jgi:predicted alpha-1,2-mannosidase